MKHYRTPVGTFRANYMAVVLFISALMQGYDSGVGGGVLTLTSFRKDFGYTVPQKTKVNSLSVGLQQLGAFLSCFVIFPITEKIGRRKAIMLSSSVMVIGVILQTINTHSLTSWYISRIIAGFGQGGSSVVVPIFCAEMAPKEIRGRLGSMYQWMYTLGVFTSYWGDYGVQKDMKSITRQWQIPVSMQIIPGALLFLSMFTLKESVRWLVKKGRSDEAWESLTWIRGDDSQETRDEFDLIGLGVNQEFAVTEGLSKKELFEPANRYRFFLAGMLFLCQQATGATALAYFAPQFFQLLVGSGNRDLLITALFGAVKLTACTFFILFMADRFGRRTLMIGGGLGMATCIFCASLVYKFLPPPGGAVTSAGEATIALIFLNIMIYNCSWGPIPWAYTPEIFSSRMREMGMSFATCIHWLFSFVFSISTPYMIASMGWGTFLFYAIMDVCMALFVFFFVKETRGQSLESMEHIFHSKAGANIDLELKLETAHVENLGEGNGGIANAISEKEI